MLNTKLFIAFLIGFTALCSAQIETYTYKRIVSEVNDEWHKITLPNAVFEKMNSNFSDLRIYGVTAKNDTIEAPYLLRILSEKVVHNSIAFDIINKTKSDDGYYFTFQLNAEDAINQIDLNFNDQNFDWKVVLQGSQNQQEWFTILEDYRILSLKNATTDFKFTKLTFPKVKYRFFRVLVKSEQQPKLQSAQLSKHIISGGSIINHTIKNIETTDNKEDRSTAINLELQQPVSMSNLSVSIGDTFDYYRPIKIEYRSDSISTEKGLKYQYRTITNGILNSLETNNFKFSNTIAKHIKITIFNGDNQALSIDGISVKGFEYQLIVRFTEPADYTFVYGNTLAKQPNYDINRFAAKIPKNLNALKLEAEEVISKKEASKVKPLFENNYWLWGIIIVVILFLGGFTLKMLKKD
tara:strand:+ start:56259 stop:57488 length:1230 start_codon:yes stop_codon:yes gene_type:complete